MSPLSDVHHGVSLLSFTEIKTPFSAIIFFQNFWAWVHMSVPGIVEPNIEPWVESNVDPIFIQDAFGFSGESDHCGGPPPYE